MSEVLALKSVQDINKIKNYLSKKSNKRDYTIFTLGINVGLRASDLLKLTVGDIYENKKVKDYIDIFEKKTKKFRHIRLNQSARELLKNWYKLNNFEDENEYIFKSRKNSNDNLIEVRSLNKMIKLWTAECHLKGNYGTHTLRKTFGYHFYQSKPCDRTLKNLQKAFNHSSSEITLRYIGIEQEEIDDLYEMINL